MVKLLSFEKFFAFFKWQQVVDRHFGNFAVGRFSNSGPLFLLQSITVTVELSTNIGNAE
jgi:hypothetical protein